MKFKVVIEEDEDNNFVVTVPALPGCVSEGKTRIEAITNIKDAILGYISSLKKHNEPVPPSITEEVVEVYG
ncbi:MAG: type II toxin-antitoxin system HicB family antitoxin [Candidatus ainarchaeum sp.]|nr:type II toxin-antitoxin system HicB family antitoxin [Candidatus ainarchaeum sp.]